jgi:hypothetical protein
MKKAMSALLRITDSNRTSSHVRKVPTADFVGLSNARSLYPATPRR